MTPLFNEILQQTPLLLYSRLQVHVYVTFVYKCPQGSNRSGPIYHFRLFVGFKNKLFAILHCTQFKPLYKQKNTTFLIKSLNEDNDIVYRLSKLFFLTKLWFKIKSKKHSMFLFGICLSWFPTLLGF